MRTYIYIILIIGGVFVTSCNDDLTELNDNEKAPKLSNQETLFSNAQLDLANTMTSANVNLNVFRLIVQYWSQTQYPDESRYEIHERSVNDNFWHALYRDVLADLNRAQELTEADEVISAEEKANQLALIDIMQVYAWSVLLTTFGDIPYEEALNIENIRPEYDDAEQIFDDLINRLNSDITTLNANSGTPVFQGADILYGGSIDQWLKFANSLKLRMGMLVADSDPAQAATIVESAAPNVFTSNADNAIFTYSTVPPNTNPIWEDLVQSGRRDFVASTTLLLALDTIGEPSDPRLPIYLQSLPDGTYVGGPPGARNTPASNYSLPGSRLLVADFEAILLDYAEVEFLLAEAAARPGMTVAGTVEEHYNAGIRASMEYWGIDEVEITGYLNDEDVDYDSAPGTWREKVGLQKWLALYNRGFTAWTEWRRLDYPGLEPAEQAYSEIPLRYFYPVSEQNLNQANYNEAADRLGGDGDTVETPLFWDVD